MNDRRYIRAYRSEFADPDSGAPFTVAMCDGSVFASRELTVDAMKALRQNIDEALHEGMVEMTNGDLYGSPNDIEF